MNFQGERHRLKNLYSQLLADARERGFEQRFDVCELAFPLEELLYSDDSARAAGAYQYCLFSDGHRVRYTRVNASEALVASKLKAQSPLSRQEKEVALEVLRRL
jgi:hypothetical protein